MRIPSVACERAMLMLPSDLYFRAEVSQYSASFLAVSLAAMTAGEGPVFFLKKFVMKLLPSDQLSQSRLMLRRCSEMEDALRILLRPGLGGCSSLMAVAGGASGAIRLRNQRRHRRQ
jgi:hypothetical protein